MIQKLRVEPPPKFTGKENFEAFLKRLTNYLSLTDENYSFIIESMKTRIKRPWSDEDYDQVDLKLQDLTPGDTKQLSRALYYTLGSLLGDAPLLIVDTTTDMNGFEALRRLMERYLHSKQMTSIMMLVQVWNIWTTTRSSLSDMWRSY